MTTPAADVSPTPESANSRGFVHLHTHSEHSKQDGLSRLGELAAAMAADGQIAGAITDHGTMAGAWRWVKACKAAGIKPILGVEAYMALVPDGSDPDSPALSWDDPQVRFARTTRMQPDAETGKVKRNTNNHLTVLARNEAGWRNLCRISNKAEESFYHKPLIDYALLKEHGEGLIVLTGCLGGPVASLVAMARSVDDSGNIVWDEGLLAEAAANLDRLIECVGRENVYVEIMDHGLSAEGWAHIVKMASLAKAAGVEVVATNDSHFVNCEDHDHHDSWLVAGELARKNMVSKDDPDRWRFNGAGYHLRTNEEMRSIHPDKNGWQRACDMTVEIANRIDDDVIPFVPLRLPQFPVPQSYVDTWESGEVAVFVDAKGVAHDAREVKGKVYRSPSAWMLHEKVRLGASALYGSFTPDLKELLRFEESVIQGAGISDYFLIVADIIEWARSDRGVPTAEFPDGEPGAKAPIYVGPGRGSAAGSATAYATGITRHVEPMTNGLLFERFLDPERAGMPDIDVDFEANRRDEVYAYAAAKYGFDKVARIGAFQGMKSKRAIKDAARVLGMVPLGEKMAGLVPLEGAVPMPFNKIFEEARDKEGEIIRTPQAREFREFVAANPQAQKILETARAFEGVVAGEGIHAAGVIISDEPLDSLLPMRRVRAKGQLVEGAAPIALWDGNDCDSFGLLKLDALGLVNLDYMHACIDNIKITTGETIDEAAIPHPNTVGDAKVDAAFSLMRSGRTQSVFQLASPGMTSLCVKVAPTKFEDLSALVALFRPGPMGADMHNRYAERKNGREAVSYDYLTSDPAEQAVIAGVLSETYGTVAYQEQLMSLAAVVSGFDAAEKNRLRKAFSKKIRSEMEALRDIFISRGQEEMALADGTPKIAFSEETLVELWRTFDASAEYLFNKSHSAAYGYLAYQTAYLKANYPVEYAAGVLSIEKDAERRIAIIGDLSDEGIKVLPPDINRSGFLSQPDTEDPRAVRFGLKEIRGVGSATSTIIAEREKNGPFTSMFDMVERLTTTEGGKRSCSVNSAILEGLAEAGAFDSFGPRLGHALLARVATSGVSDMEVPDAEWGHLERVSRQRERLEFSADTHPLVEYADTIENYKPYDTVDGWDPFEDNSQSVATVDTAVEQGANGRVIGLMSSWTEALTKKDGSRWARFTLEGVRHRIEGVAFPRTYEDWATRGELPRVGTIVAVAGPIEKNSYTVTNDEGEEETRERLQVKANKATLIEVDNDPVYNLAAWSSNLGKEETEKLRGRKDVYSVHGKINSARNINLSGPPGTPKKEEPVPEPTPLPKPPSPEVTPERDEPAKVTPFAPRTRGDRFAAILKGDTFDFVDLPEHGIAAPDEAMSKSLFPEGTRTQATLFGRMDENNSILRAAAVCTCNGPLEDARDDTGPCENCPEKYVYITIVHTAEFLDLVPLMWDEFVDSEDKFSSLGKKAESDDRWLKRFAEVPISNKAIRDFRNSLIEAAERKASEQ